MVRQREVVDAFFAAADLGDLTDWWRSSIRTSWCERMEERHVRTPRALQALPVAAQTIGRAQASAPKLPVLVNGAAGVVIALEGQPMAVMGFTVSGGKISEINAIVDPQRIRRIDLAALHD